MTSAGNNPPQATCSTRLSTRGIGEKEESARNGTSPPLLPFAIPTDRIPEKKEEEGIATIPVNKERRARIPEWVRRKEEV